MKKNSFKSYIYTLTALLAVSGMLVGCTNSVSTNVNLESVDTLESDATGNANNDSADSDIIYAGTADETVADEPNKEVADSADGVSTESGSAENESKVLAESGVVGDFEYTLEGSMDSGFFLDRGYFLMASDETDEVILAVCSGKRSTGGYSIEISDIDYTDPLMTITVKENTPAPDMMVTEAFTCPICFIRLSSLPGDLKIVTASGDELKFQGNYHEEFKSGNDYIAILCDGSGEIMQKTYVYKTDDGRYKYVNVESRTESWGSPKWKDTLTGSGVVDTKEELIEIARNHNSCGHVQLPFEINDTDDKDYTIITYEELQSHFISIDEFLAQDF